MARIDGVVIEQNEGKALLPRASAYPANYGILPPLRYLGRIDLAKRHRLLLHLCIQRQHDRQMGDVDDALGDSDQAR